MPRVAVCLCAALLLTPGALGAQPYTPTIAVSPNAVSAGGQVTITATIRNDGPTDSANFLPLTSFPRELAFVSASAPSGWTVEHLGNIEFHDYTRFGPARLSSHASVTFSVTVGIPATMWPGETISPISLGGTAAASTELVIAGAAPPPAAQPQLFVIPPTTSGCSMPDPFVSLGGGTCRNGGWYPPGMQLPG